MELLMTLVDIEDWLQLVIACYPFSAIGGPQVIQPARSISPDERKLLYELFQKQRHVAGGSAFINQLPVVQMLLSKLMVVSVGYCWNEFSDEDWDFLLSNLRCWIQSTVVMMEDVAENVNGLLDSSSDNLDVMCKKIEKIVLISDPFPIKISESALLSFSLFLKHCKLQQAEEGDNLNTLKSEKLDSVKDRILEGILRLLFCTGISEAIANACCKEAASVIASSRVEYTYFWELVASGVVNSSSQARDRALKSVEFWGLSKGSISSLYAILFTSKPIPLLQFAAYFVLSNEPVINMAVVEDNACKSDIYAASDQDSSRPDMSMEEKVHLKQEISCMVERAPYEVLEMDLLAQQRVRMLYVTKLNYVLYVKHFFFFNVYLFITLSFHWGTNGRSLPPKNIAGKSLPCLVFVDVTSMVIAFIIISEGETDPVHTRLCYFGYFRLPFSAHSSRNFHGSESEEERCRAFWWFIRSCKCCNPCHYNWFIVFFCGISLAC